MAKKLGKGLGEIFGDNIDSVLDEISNGASDVKGDKLLISVSEIRPNPYQPRKLFDEEALIIDDPEHSLEEERFIILGLSKKANLLVVCHCYRESDTIIRIISARKATVRETISYNKNLF